MACASVVEATDTCSRGRSATLAVAVAVGKNNSWAATRSGAISRGRELNSAAGRDRRHFPTLSARIPARRWPRLPLVSGRRLRWLSFGQEVPHQVVELVGTLERHDV